MHARQMVALEIVIYIRLPIALHAVVATLHEVHFRERKFRDLGRKLAQVFGEGWSMGIEIDKYPLLPRFAANWTQAKLIVMEILDALHFGRAEQVAFERVSPAVVAATKDLARAATFGGWPRAMAADVVKAAQSAIIPAGNKNGFARDLRSEIVAGLRDLLATTHYLPSAREDPVALIAENLRIKIKTGRQAPGASNIPFAHEFVSARHATLRNIPGDSPRTKFRLRPVQHSWVARDADIGAPLFSRVQ